MKNRILFALLFCSFNLGFSQIKDSIPAKQQFIINNNITYEYTKPKFSETFKYIPKDIFGLGKYLVNKENTTPVMLTVASTIAIIPFDEKITTGASQLGSHINLDNEGTYFRIKGVRMFPKNFPAAIYFIGNGGTTLLLGSSFFIAGKLKKDYRLQTTSSEIFEGFIATAIASQTLKRITGRQSPAKNMQKGSSGQWTFFPSFKAFQTKTPNYDAMPSGHLATFMTTLTIIVTNYPEVKWIKPVGYSLASLLAFQMVSSKVHWTSDYPIAVLFGYVIGKNIANRRINKIKNLKIGSSEINYKTHFTYANVQGFTTIGLTISF